MFFIAFLPSQPPLRETERRMENGVMGFLFLGGVWRTFMVVFGRKEWNNCIAARGREEGGGCLYIRILSISSFLSRCWNWRLFIVPLWF